MHPLLLLSNTVFIYIHNDPRHPSAKMQQSDEEPLAALFSCCSGLSDVGCGPASAALCPINSLKQPRPQYSYLI